MRIFGQFELAYIPISSFTIQFKRIDSSTPFKNNGIPDIQGHHYTKFK